MLLKRSYSNYQELCQYKRVQMVPMFSYHCNQLLSIMTKDSSFPYFFPSPILLVQKPHFDQKYILSLTWLLIFKLKSIAT